MNDSNRTADAVSQLLARCGAPSPYVPDAAAVAWAPAHDDPPPSDRTALEVDALEETLLARLKVALLEGTTIVRSDDECHVEHSLGCEWVLDWQAGTSRCRTVGSAHVGPWQNAALSLTSPLQDDSWIRGWIASVEPGRPSETMNQLVRQLWDRLQRSPELREGRRQLLAARFQMAQPIELALRLWADMNPSSDRLVFLRQVRADVEARQRENPRLLPLLGLVPKDELDVWTHDYRALRTYLTKQGLTAAGWKRLCQHGRRLWQGAVGSARLAESPFVAIIPIANALGRLGEKRVPPPEVVGAFVDADGLIVAGQELKRLVPAKLLAAASSQWRRLSGKPARRAFARAELTQVIDWWQQTDQEEGAVPPRAGWAWFARRAAAWRADEAARRRAQDEAWDCGLPDTWLDGLQFVPLRSALALWREGQVMRNCLGEPEYGKRSQRQAYALVSIRRPGRTRSLATFAAHCSRGRVPGIRQGFATWTLGDMKGFANRAPDPSLAAVAERYLTQVNLAHAANHAAPIAPHQRRRGRSPDLRLRFLGQRYGILFLELVSGKESVVLRLSNALESLHSIVRWLEAVASGVSTCAAYTDGEGLYRELRYSGHDDGIFRVIDGDEEPLVTRISRTDLVAAFYGGLRGMLTSSMGRTLDWEPGTLWDRLEACLSLRPTRAILAHQLANFSRARLEAILDRLGRMGGAGRDEREDRANVLALLGSEEAVDGMQGSDLEPTLHAGFDDWPLAMRIETLNDALMYPPREGTGTRLHWQRSVLVEAWLQASSVDLERWVATARAACDKEMASGLVELARRDRYGLPEPLATPAQGAGENAPTMREE
jgi:hypothetical protein